ncbi:uncharacterized protein LOC131859420 isoform X1 [Cryptomeria japonica]|uniref:uncharacterized protein LOC131859420 isoform X1 n=1 Tax=Cryptomeria japonica TaxID=3369 RepID=UPI0027DA9A70|nr:uncharacterized protein LOC131859420 isoform X1 [Cryptomeria japonica]
MERGVATTVASSTALTEEGLVTPDHERAPVVDEHHDYLYLVSDYSIICHSKIQFLYMLTSFFSLYRVELQKSLERRSNGRTRKTPASYTSPSPRQAKISHDLFPSPRGK